VNKDTDTPQTYKEEELQRRKVSEYWSNQNGLFSSLLFDEPIYLGFRGE
jgi:hypothetical protein